MNSLQKLEANLERAWQAEDAARAAYATAEAAADRARDALDRHAQRVKAAFDISYATIDRAPEARLGHEPIGPLLDEQERLLAVFSAASRSRSEASRAAHAAWRRRFNLEQKLDRARAAAAETPRDGKAAGFADTKAARRYMSARNRCRMAVEPAAAAGDEQQEFWARFFEFAKGAIYPKPDKLYDWEALWQGEQERAYDVAKRHDDLLSVFGLVANKEADPIDAALVPLIERLGEFTWREVFEAWAGANLQDDQAWGHFVCVIRMLPFDPRRSAAEATAAATTPEKTGCCGVNVYVGGLQADLLAKIAAVRGGVIHLTAKEAEAVRSFAALTEPVPSGRAPKPDDTESRVPDPNHTCWSGTEVYFHPKLAKIILELAHYLPQSGRLIGVTWDDLREIKEFAAGLELP
ncbi:hypothetical protein SAMN06265365_1487 [Tistlia consotensis]|uniref:Uncharacterized protein n=1 Tax=Tistlia consotensis USBA 355 TaxID=560819 RepID=A0A1Y6CR87_9PROT|nr:hypothetical protein [Tistlia consotensis]SMF82846.1 hypothetical protein SAMN05428998_1488 [Tistlia consotensis USBA 355]SNS31084.1 hypothetical protein SAMN06265365_1487 [Tistlia consotensis]